MLRRELGLVAVFGGAATLLGASAMFIDTGSLRAQTPAEPATLPACQWAGTYTLDVDGAPDKGACRGFVDQAEPVSFNIPSGLLFDALKAFLEQSGSRGMVPLDIMADRIPTAGVSSVLPPREALERLLSDTGVSYVQDQTGTFRFPPIKGASVPGGQCVWDKLPPNACP